MRDPNRIELILNAIQKFWIKFPDLRLGQLLEIIKSKSSTPDVDIFLFEDSQIVQILEILENEIKCNNL